jgi:hypothetical protein
VWLTAREVVGPVGPRAADQLQDDDDGKKRRAAERRAEMIAQVHWKSPWVATSPQNPRVESRWDEKRLTIRRIQNSPPDEHSVPPACVVAVEK